MASVQSPVMKTGETGSLKALTSSSVPLGVSTSPKLSWVGSAWTVTTSPLGNLPGCNDRVKVEEEKIWILAAPNLCQMLW
eukprot:688688-Rhodomonas_salina.2